MRNNDLYFGMFIGFILTNLIWIVIVCSSGKLKNKEAVPTPEIPKVDSDGFKKKIGEHLFFKDGTEGVIVKRCKFDKAYWRAYDGDNSYTIVYYNKNGEYKAIDYWESELDLVLKKAVEEEKTK